VPAAHVAQAARLGETAAVHEGLVPVHTASTNGDVSGSPIKVSDA
jgi:hypothetical protein